MLDRLTSALTGGTNRTYGYDAIGNRTTSTVDAASTTYAYPPTSHRLSSLTGATTRSYAYDGAGNPIQVDGRTATYNLANRLAKLADGAATVATYKLNGLGQRVAKAVGGTTTRYVYDEQGRLTGEYQANGTLIQETVWLDDLPVATLRPTGSGNPTPVAVYYVHADHLGSPRAITRPSDDAILWRWENVEPFGNNQANENPAGLGTFRYDLRFPGQQFDAETGTHYNYFRDYDASVGRYVQSDPIGLGGGINTYVYVGSNPVDRTDPSGLRVQLCCRAARFQFGSVESSLGVEHCWIKTDSVAAGMGNDVSKCSRPGEGQFDYPGTRVFVSEHSCDVPDRCGDVSNVDEACVNRELAIGRGLGRFIPGVNDCQSFVREVFRKCRKR